MRKSRKRKRADRWRFGLGILAGLTLRELIKLYNEDRRLQFESDNWLIEHCPISKENVDVFITELEKSKHDNPHVEEK